LTRGNKVTKTPDRCSEEKKKKTRVDVFADKIKREGGGGGGGEEASERKREGL